MAWRSRLLVPVWVGWCVACSTTPPAGGGGGVGGAGPPDAEAEAGGSGAGGVSGSGGVGGSVGGSAGSPPDAGPEASDAPEDVGPEACADGDTLQDGACVRPPPDPCDPNPCLTPGRTACRDAAGVPVCECSPGFHEDGIGGCTDDVCLPNPCESAGLACRPARSGYECWSPNCDDAEPCTRDDVVGGACMHTALLDGQPCATSACLRDQRCSAGVCSGGVPHVCDDGNPCTDEACSDPFGCTWVSNDATRPDDGVACTVDSCLSGVELHAPADWACDDGLWCDGFERCQPASTEAAPSGCVAGTPPSPPPSPGPCAAVGACDESTDAFTIATVTLGAPCDDGIDCTADDRCAAGGSCRGVPIADCEASIDCTAAARTVGDIDLRVAQVEGTLSLGGAALPATSDAPEGADLFLVAQSTGARHHLGGYAYDYESGATYRLRTGTYGGKVVAGLYDLQYSRGWSSSERHVERTEATADHVAGHALLARDLVIGAGPVRLDVDVPVATVTGTLTLGGSALPATHYTNEGPVVYLRARGTGALHVLGRAWYWYAGGEYVLDTVEYGGKYVAGTYDVLYTFEWNHSANWVPWSGLTPEYPGGHLVLQSGVVLAPGANTLDVDIPAATVTGTITLDGAPLPATHDDDLGASIYLVAHDTRTWHLIGGYSYEWFPGDVYQLSADTYGSRLVAGTYDILYRRNSGSTGVYIDATPPGAAHVDGEVLLRRDVVIPPGASTLDVDVPSGTVTGTLTLAGATPPATSSAPEGAELYLVARGTGVLHHLGGYSYAYQSPGVYTLRGGAFAARFVAGTYDLLYVRGWDELADTVGRNAVTSPHVSARVMLREGVVITPGANTLDVDVPIGVVSGTVRIAGSPPPATSADPLGGDFFLVSRETGTRHHLGGYAYAPQPTGDATLVADGYGGRVVAGTYDLLYSRRWSAATGLVPRTPDGEVHVSGHVLLARAVVVPSGASALDVDLPVGLVTGALTVAGAAAPPMVPLPGDAAIFLMAPGTGAAHHLGGHTYAFQAAGVYALQTDSLGGQVPRQPYHLLYSLRWDPDANLVPRTPTGDPHVAGRVRIARCVAPP